MGTYMVKKTCCYVFYLSTLTILVMGLPTTRKHIIGTIQVNNNINTAKEQVSSNDFVKHLAHYGYLQERVKSVNLPIYTDKEVEESLKEYQKFMDLGLTGKPDDNTLKNMNKPRCGKKDKNDGNNISIKMVLTASGQRKRRQIHNMKEMKIWYLIAPMPDTKMLNPNLVYFQMEAAFNVWAGVTNLVFVRGDGIKRSDILISFYKGSHGDRFPFNGTGRDMTHSFPNNKIIHFNNDENWTWQQDGTSDFRWIHPANKGIDFVQLAVHQIGHILKLSHSNERNSVMFPIFPKSEPYTEYRLSDNDMTAIQNAYGICEPKKFEAIFDHKYKDGETYIITGPYIYKFKNTEQQVEQSWPRSVYRIYGGSKFPDEVFWNTDRFMYWFTGNKYYVYTTEQNEPSEMWYVLQDTDGKISWEGLREGKVDAACVIKENTFIFRKDLVYKLTNNDTLIRPRPPYQIVDSGWPKKITDVFPGIPNDIDTAFTWGFDGRTYFFKNRYFYIWDPKSKINTALTYGIYQWRNVCNVYQCKKGPSPSNNYKCDSWS